MSQASAVPKNGNQIAVELIVHGALSSPLTIHSQSIKILGFTD